jgi:uncharacterized membrane-anchored protein
MSTSNAPGLTATSPDFITPIHDRSSYETVPIQDAPTAEVVLKGASIAAIADSDGITTKLVIFRPTRFTRDAVRIFENCAQDLVIEDANGRFTPRSPKMIVGHLYEASTDTMIVTTENYLE